MIDHLYATQVPVCHIFSLEGSHVNFVHAREDMEFQRLVQIFVQTKEVGLLVKYLLFGRLLDSGGVGRVHWSGSGIFW